MAAERAAKKEGRTESGLFREALRRYLQDMKWAELRRYGAERAARLGIGEADIERLIHEYRQGSRRSAS